VRELEGKIPLGLPNRDRIILKVKSKKVKLSRCMPWRHMGEEEV
jgi:hypothetical protein